MGSWRRRFCWPIEPFAIDGPGSRIRDRCDQAQLFHCSTPGLRKAGATIAAGNGTNDEKRMAIFGRRRSRQIARSLRRTTFTSWCRNNRAMSCAPKGLAKSGTKKLKKSAKPMLKKWNGAQKRTRTSTPFRVPAPEAGASTNSAIWATESDVRGWLLTVNWVFVVFLTVGEKAADHMQESAGEQP